MSGLQPQGERLRRAVRHVSDRLRDEPSARMAKLVDEATLRFDLSPREAESLLDFFRHVDAKRQGDESDET